MTTITLIDSLDDTALRAGLEALLDDAVASGASVGFHHPMPLEQNRGYWNGVATQMAGGGHKLLVARDAEGTVVGSVQLALCLRPNGVHRAEVQKLLVLTARRRQGLATRLMDTVEELARSEERTLLVLDTLKDNFGEPFYRQAGWTRVGEIPGYTIEADGTFHATVVFYKTL